MGVNLRLKQILVALTVLIACIGFIYAAIPNNTLQNNWLVVTNMNATTGYYLGGEDVTDILAYPQQPTSYIVWRTGANYYAKNGSTGEIEYSSNNASAVFINVLQSGNRIVFSDGVYEISTAYSPTNLENITIEGWGFNTVLSVNSNWIFENCSNLIIKNLRVDNNNHTGYFTRFDNCTDILLDGLYVSSSSDHGIALVDSYDAVIQNCIVEDNYDDGIALAANTYQVTVIGNIARNQYAGTSYSTGIEIDDGAHDITVSGNICYNNAAGYGIDVHSHTDLSKPRCYNIVISGNTLIGDSIYVGATGAASAPMSRPRDVVVTGNTVNDGYIYTDRSYHVSILSNVVVNSTDAGIISGTTSNFAVIDGNSVYNSASYGISVKSKNTVVSNNVVEDATTRGIRVREGSASKISVIGNIVKNSGGIETSLNDVIIQNNIIVGGILYVNGGDMVLVSGNNVNASYVYVTASSTNVQITDNMVKNPTGDGIIVLSDYAVITNNRVYDINVGGVHGMSIQGDYILAEGNIIDDTSNGHGIDIVGIYANIHGNVISNIAGSGKDCINVNAGANYTQIQDNYLEDGVYGVDIAAGAFNTTIKNNLFYSQSTSPINDGGTNTKTRENEPYADFGDIRLNAGNIEMWNSTAWVIIGP